MKAATIAFALLLGACGGRDDSSFLCKAHFTCDEGDLPADGAFDVNVGAEAQSVEEAEASACETAAPPSRDELRCTDTAGNLRDPVCASASCHSSI